MNSIDERCYGYEPAASQLRALREQLRTANHIIQNLKRDVDMIKKQMIVHPEWLNTGCPDHGIPRCQCCCDDWYMNQLEPMVENA